LNDAGNSIAVNSAGEAFVAGTTLSTTSYGLCGVCGHNSLPPAVATSVGLPTTANSYMATPVSLSQNCTLSYYAQVYAFLARFSAAGALEYSTYFGPGAPDNSRAKTTYATGIALDAANDVYLAGSTDDSAFPTTAGAAQTQCVSCSQQFYSAWAAKFNPVGGGNSDLLYSTIIGSTGSFNHTYGNGIAVDAQDNAYVTGSTLAPDFPTTATALQAIDPSFVSSAFVTKLNSTGTQRVYSTYLGGSGYSNAYGNAIAVDSSGAASVTGQTGNGFTFTFMNPLYTTLAPFANGFLLRLTPDGSQTSFGTYFGFNTTPTGVAVDNNGNAYLAGYSDNIPTTLGSYSPCPNLNNCSSINGNYDAFAAKISMGTTNTPPVANAGASQTVECTGPTTSITLNGSASSDPDGDALTFLWKDQNTTVVGNTAIANVACSLGVFTYYLTVTDSAGLSSNANTQVTVRDTTPPLLTLSRTTLTATLPTASAATMAVSLAGIASATDTCDPSPTISNNAPAQFPIGNTTVKFTATDHSGNQSVSQQLTVQVTYSFGGIQQPLTPNGSYHAGRVIPVQFPLTAADGSVVTNATATLQAFQMVGTALLPVPVSSPGNSYPGTQFRFDPSTGQYVYNLDTKSYSLGTYVLRITINDQTTYSVQIMLT
jgi:hypothetical protein